MVQHAPRALPTRGLATGAGGSFGVVAVESLGYVLAGSSLGISLRHGALEELAVTMVGASRLDAVVVVVGPVADAAHIAAAVPQRQVAISF